MDDSIDQLDLNLIDCIDQSDQSINMPLTKDNTSNDTEQPGDFSGTNLNTVQPATGERIAVYWPHKNCSHIIHHDDNEIEVLNMNDYKWILDSSMNGSTSRFSKILPSNEQEAWSAMLGVLGNRPFLRHYAQAFDQTVIVNA